MRIQRPFLDSPIVWAAAAAAVVGTFGLLRAGEPQPQDAPKEPGQAAFRTAIANVKGKTMTGIIVDFKPGAVVPPHRHGDAFVVAYVLEIGEQMGRTPACDRDPPGDRWHRRGSRCAKSYSDFLDFFAFIDSRNR